MGWLALFGFLPCVQAGSFGHATLACDGLVFYVAGLIQSSV
jgi:hypothetical protein